MLTVNNVAHGYRRAGTVVHYSRPESEIAQLWKTMGEMQTKQDIMQTKFNVLQSKVEELQEKIGVDAEVLAEWQTASLVLSAFGVFTWDLVSAIDKTNLAKYNIHTFWDLYHAKLRTGPGKNSALHIYRKLDQNVVHYVDNLKFLKGTVAANQAHLAHPSITDARLLEFLARLGSGNPGLDPLEVEMFNFLRSVSNTKENIDRAKGLKLS